MIEIGFAFMVGCVLLVANKTIKQASEVPRLTQAARAASRRQRPRPRQDQLPPPPPLDVETKEVVMSGRAEMLRDLRPDQDEFNEKAAFYSMA